MSDKMIDKNDTKIAASSEVTTSSAQGSATDPDDPCCNAPGDPHGGPDT